MRKNYSIVHTHTRVRSWYFTLLGIFLVFLTLPLYSAEVQPWYANSLESLGFFVFDSPTDQPNFSVASLNGSVKNRLSTKGNVTLLNFWATWCPPCRQEIPSLQRLYTAMQGEKFEIMAISVGESPATVKAFIEQSKIKYPVYLDPKGSLGRTYASRGIPTTYILDKNGKVIAGIIGSFAYDDPAFIAIIKELARK